MKFLMKLSVDENDIIFHTVCWENALEESTKFELFFWFQSMNYVADALNEKML